MRLAQDQKAKIISDIATGKNRNYDSLSEISPDLIGMGFVDSTSERKTQARWLIQRKQNEKLISGIADSIAERISKTIEKILVNGRAN
jgi:hypothetical protein